MNTVPCPKCGATKRVRGRIYERGSLADIRFKPDETPKMSLKEQAVSLFSFKKRLLASACQQCGFVEFYLDTHET
jgi:predicted nucleic-acid-binding Zn-ribbon protein